MGGYDESTPLRLYAIATCNPESLRQYCVLRLQRYRQGACVLLPKTEACDRAAERRESSAVQGSMMLTMARRQWVWIMYREKKQKAHPSSRPTRNATTISIKKMKNCCRPLERSRLQIGRALPPSPQGLPGLARKEVVPVHSRNRARLRWSNYKVPAAQAYHLTHPSRGEARGTIPLEASSRAQPHSQAPVSTARCCSGR